MSKIIKESFKKPDDPIYKEGFKTFTPLNKKAEKTKYKKEESKKDNEDN